MPMQTIALGTPPNAQDGDDARTAFLKINQNMEALNTAGVTGPVNRNTEDFNSAVDPGYYTAYSTGAPANAPPGVGYAIFHVYTTDIGWVVQDATNIFTGKPWRRVLNPGTGVWSSWDSAPHLQTSRTDPDTSTAMSPGAFGIGAESIPAGAAQGILFNDFKMSGIYGYYQDEAAPQYAVNVLESRWGMDSTWMTQLVMGVASNDMWYRSFRPATGPLPFAKLLSSLNVLGPVGGAPGAVDGGLFESSANALGYYFKLADGTLVCVGSGHLPAQALGVDNYVNIYFPAPFVYAPNVITCPSSSVGSGSQASVGLAMMNGFYYSSTATFWSLRSYSYRYATTEATAFSYIAVGRWRA